MKIILQIWTSSKNMLLAIRVILINLWNSFPSQFCSMLRLLWEHALAQRDMPVPPPVRPYPPVRRTPCYAHSPVLNKYRVWRTKKVVKGRKEIYVLLFGLLRCKSLVWITNPNKYEFVFNEYISPVKYDQSVIQCHNQYMKYDIICMILNTLNNDPSVIQKQNLTIQ